MKKCPFCAEEIQGEAIKCKHCGEFLDGRAPASAPEKKKAGWFFSPGVIFIGFLCVGPFILPLVWMHPTYSRNKKFILTFIILAVSWVLGKLFIQSLHELEKYWDMMGGNYTNT